MSMLLGRQARELRAEISFRVTAHWPTLPNEALRPPAADHRALKARADGAQA
jgi:hypothetical protein